MISVDSNAPYATAFGPDLAPNAVYLTAKDAILGEIFAVVYSARPAKLSVILLGNHGTSGYVDMTLDASSKFYDACRALSPNHYNSPVRRALAIACLRTFSTMDRPLLKYLVHQQGHHKFEDSSYLFDETAAGTLGSRFKLVYGKLPRDLGHRVLESGVLCPKTLNTSVVDVVYKDSDETIDQDNELVYSLGSQLEQLFNPLSEYSPEPAEQLYSPPRDSIYTLEDDPSEAQSICEELYIVQSHLRADLIDFHQNFLVPLRIAVLRNEIPDLTLSRLNSIFPPTFDEVLRINNLFYVALQDALPYGSFEVLRACGITLPYFYRALMRHEAATHEFSRLKVINVPEFQRRMQEYGPAKIDTVVRSSLNLTKLKLLLDRLATSKDWPENQLEMVEELHEVAVATVDSFGRATVTPEQYERRTLTPSGKLLSELTTGWPTELEYGWMHNRRVVAIFDGSDVFEENKSRQQLHHIMVLFTDILIILQPQRPIPMTSMSGLRIPYIGDMLMHSLLNQVPLDHNLPQLKVIAWQAIANLTFTSYNNDRFIQISSQPQPFLIGRDNLSDKNLFSKSYRLTQPDQSADRLADILTKTKIATKLQDLHIFKFSCEEEPDVSIYATVHEMGHYLLEKTRFPVCIFMNQEIDVETLQEYGLFGAISVEFGAENVSVRVLSKFNYSTRQKVPWASYRNYVITEICYLMTLYLSSQNQEALPSIVGSNLQNSHKLVSWAMNPGQAVPAKGHRRHPNTSRDLRQAAAVLSPVAEEEQEGYRERDPTSGDSISAEPAKARNASVHSTDTQNFSREINVPRTRNTRTPGDGPSRLKKKENFDVQRNRDDSFRDLAKRPSIASYGLASSNGSVQSGATPGGGGGIAGMARGQSMQSMGSGANETAIIYHYGEDTVSDFRRYNTNETNDETTTNNNNNNNDWESMMSEDDVEQRDVDEWFQQLDHKDAQSLSTSISDMDFSSHTHSRTSSKNTEASEFQIGGFLDEQESEIYNSHAGGHYPEIHLRSASEVSGASGASAASGASGASAASGFSGASAWSDTSNHSAASTIRSGSGSSRVVSQEYSWMAGIVHGTSGSSSQEPPTPERTSAQGSQQSLNHKRSTSSKLYAGLRESSIMDLSSFLVTSETSQSLDLLALLQQENEKDDVLGSNEPTPKLT